MSTTYAEYVERRRQLSEQLHELPKAERQAAAQGFPSLDRWLDTLKMIASDLKSLDRWHAQFDGDAIYVGTFMSTPPLKLPSIETADDTIVVDVFGNVTKLPRQALENDEQVVERGATFGFGRTYVERAETYGQELDKKYEAASRMVDGHFAAFDTVFEQPAGGEGGNTRSIKEA